MKTPNHYQIQVQGHFDEALAEWFVPLSIANQPNGDAKLTGPVRDQAELFGILLKLYNLNFNLIAVQPLEHYRKLCSANHLTKGENHE